MSLFRLRAVSGVSKCERESKEIVFALCCLMFIPSLNNFLNSFLQIGLSLKIEILTPIAYIFMAFVSAFILYKYIFRRRIFVFSFLALLLGTVISYCIYPEIRSVIYSSPVDLVYSPINKLFFFCVPALIGAVCLTDHDRLFRSMRNWGRLSVVLGVITYIFVFFVFGKTLQYMVFSYFMLLPICVCFEHAGVNGSKLDLLIAITGSVSIVLCGARGAVVSLILYFIARIILTGFGRWNKMKVLTLFASLFLVVLLLAFYEDILIMISDLLKSFGINSRFLTYLVEGALLDGTGRSTITGAVFNGLMNNPLGYGLFGDRYVVGTFGFGRYTYSHSIITELLCDFGIVAGSVIVVVLALYMIRYLVSIRGKREVNLMLALIPYGVFQLLFSSSFLENIVFFIIIGLCFFPKTKSIKRTQNGDAT